MSDVIQCPSCDKKFRLPANPPATYTCNACGTLMDLSDFGGAEQPAEAPPEPAREAGVDEGGPRTRRSRARGGRRRAAPSAPGPAAGPSRSRGGGRRRARGGRGRRGRGAPDAAYDEGYEDEGRVNYRSRRQGPNTALIVGSVAALVAAIVLIIVVSSGKSDDPGTGKETADENAKKGGLMDKSGGGAPVGDAPEATGDDTPKDDDDPYAELVKAGKRAGRGKRIKLSRIPLQQFPWPEEVDELTRTKVDEAIQNLYRGARDGLEAKEFLIQQGRPICGRIISEFKVIVDGMGLENREAKSRLGALDSLLRQIDGWIERYWEDRDRVQPHSTPSFVMIQLRRWTYWWQSDEWKIKPRKPWDPMEDESDESEDGIRRPEDEPKREGFDKPAGR